MITEAESESQTKGQPNHARLSKLHRIYEDKQWADRSWINEMAPFRGMYHDIKVISSN